MLRRAATLTLPFVLFGLAGAPAATAAPTPLGLADCRIEAGARLCSGIVATWDGVPLDTTVALPADADPGRDGPLPLLVTSHGFGNSKHEYLDPTQTAYTDNVHAWARDGYAVLAFTARGLWGSCGTPEARLARPGPCARGYLHLADVRYEVRDTQELVGRLVDGGIADPARIGTTGDSYGGGQSLMLAALRDRVMLPDGRLAPWRSPAGVPLRLAAAAPVIPWSHLVHAIAPNGRSRLGEDVPLRDLSEPVGVFQLSVANAILLAAQNATGPGQPVGEPFVPGRPMGFVAPLGTDPDADVLRWVARSDIGEPYNDPDARGIVDRLVRFRSAEAIDASVPPPPLLLAAGFTDDLFPASESVRFAERVRRRHPSVPVSVLLGDIGHQRSTNEPRNRALLLTRLHAFFDHHLRGIGRAPRTGVEALTQACPRGTAADGPFRAPDLGALATRRLVHRAAGPWAISSLGGSPSTSLAVDPVTGGGDGCVALEAPRAADAGTARIALPAAPAGGTLLLGAPRIAARIRVRGAAPTVAQLQVRLWDVGPDRRQRLVARGSLRPTGGARDLLELHPNGWRFPEGHAPVVELLGADAPYARPSNAAFTLDVDDLEVVLPVRDPTAAEACTSRRRVVVRPGTLRAGERIRRASVRIGAGSARRATVVRRGTGVRVDLSGRTAGRYRVRVRATTTRGRVLTATRTLRTCVPRR